MKEFGFWEYTCSGAGRAARYEADDWERLLDDMAGAGMNSLALVVKWYTTGYRSRLEWLDQDVGSPAVATDNALLHSVMQKAHARCIRVWIVAVCSYFRVREFGIAPPDVRAGDVFAYDPDQPGVLEKVTMMMAEIAELFGGAADGMVVEMENADADRPHRIALYDAWAAAEGRPDHRTLRRKALDPRSYQKHDWRDFTTWRRCCALKQIQQAVRSKGFEGDLAMICEARNEYGAYAQAVNLQAYREAMPGWKAVTYGYNRDVNRWAGLDFCIEQPKRAGLETYYLGRGVMTYRSCPWDMSISLADHWRIDIEDVSRFPPAGFWFFSADADERPNPHTELARLKAWGFRDGRDARKALLASAKVLAAGL